MAVASCIAVPAGAQTRTANDPSVDTLRAEADAIATSYLAALSRAQELDQEITRSEQTITTLEAKAAAARDAARARAVAAYRQSGSRFAAVVDSSTLMAASRRARLVNEVNRADHETYARLRQASADLRAERRALDDRRAAQAVALADLHDQATAADAKLAEAQRAAAAQAAAQAAQAAQAAAATAAATASISSSAPAPPSAAAVPSTGGPTSTTAPPITKPTPPLNYSGTPGTHPHHDDEFLTCLRQRESGGNYGAVSSAGYLGAYQFAQSTWNLTANRSGRTELIGVPVNLASPYDQDDMAWSLYQSVGKGPWGGGCT